MKKQLVLFLLSVVLLLGKLPLVAQTVYVTNTGEKYHNAGCRYLRKSANAMNLADAIAQGYTACSVCKPPTTATRATTQEKKPTSTATQKKVGVSRQCSASTQSGKRCSRMTTSPNGKCWQHGGD